MNVLASVSNWFNLWLKLLQTYEARVHVKGFAGLLTANYTIYYTRFAGMYVYDRAYYNRYRVPGAEECLQSRDRIYIKRTIDQEKNNE